MNVILYLILIFVACFGFCVGILIIQNKYRTNKGDAAHGKNIYRAYKNLGITFGVVVVVLTLIYGLVPYQGETGFGVYASRIGVPYWTSISNILRVLVVELTVGLIIIAIAKYRGTQNSASRFADPQYLKQYSRKVVIWTNVCMGITLVILLIIKCL